MAWGENAAAEDCIFDEEHLYYLWYNSEGHYAAMVNPYANGMICAVREYNGRVFGIQIFIRDPNYTTSTQSAVNNDKPVDDAVDNDAEEEPDKSEETVEYKADKANEGSTANAEVEKTSEDVVTPENKVDTTESDNTEDSNDTNDAESKKLNSEDMVESGESPENVTDTDDEAAALIDDEEIYFTDDSEEDSASEDGTVEIPAETVNDTLYVANVANVVNDEIEPALPEIVEEPAEVIHEETTPEPEAVEPAEEETISEATEDVAEEVTPNVVEETTVEEPVTTDEVVAE